MKYVDHNGMGVPNDLNYLNFPWLYDGVNFIVFEDFEEKDQYCRQHYPNWFVEEEIIQE